MGKKENYGVLKRRNSIRKHKNNHKYGLSFDYFVNRLNLLWQIDSYNKKDKMEPAVAKNGR